MKRAPFRFRGHVHQKKQIQQIPGMHHVEPALSAQAAHELEDLPEGCRVFP